MSMLKCDKEDYNRNCYHDCSDFNKCVKKLKLTLNPLCYVKNLDLFDINYHNYNTDKGCLYCSFNVICKKLKYLGEEMSE